MEPSTSKTSRTEPEAATPKASKAAKTSKKAKAPKLPKPAKEPTPQREAIENPVVFAFRLSEADRTRIHAAAGPAGATRFVRSAALAAASGDRDAFDALVAQAKGNLQ